MLCYQDRGKKFHYFTKLFTSQKRLLFSDLFAHNNDWYIWLIENKLNKWAYEIMCKTPKQIG